MSYPIRMLGIMAACAAFFAALAAPQGSTFYVDGRFLYDPCGNKVVLRGANAMIVYWDRHGTRSYPELAKTGANCCRIFWSTGHAPEPVIPASDLDKTLANCRANKMIPMPALWDATGDWSKLDACVDYWLRDDVLAVLKKHQNHLRLNIANEAGSGTVPDFASKYSSIVKKLRSAGLKCPLVIDADGYGRHFQMLITHGQTILEQDTERNLIFSWHNWDPATWNNGTKAKIKEAVDQSIAKNICFIFGEFGPCEQCWNCGPTPIEWEYMIEYGHQNQIGWLAWVWRWDDCHGIVGTSKDTYGSWANAPWGQAVAVSSTYSIQKTAQRTSYLQNGTCGDVPVRPGIGGNREMRSGFERVQNERGSAIYTVDGRRIYAPAGSSQSSGLKTRWAKAGVVLVGNAKGELRMTVTGSACHR